MIAPPFRKLFFWPSRSGRSVGSDLEGCFGDTLPDGVGELERVRRIAMHQNGIDPGRDGLACRQLQSGPAFWAPDGHLECFEDEKPVQTWLNSMFWSSR